jgi:2-iminobutanoate/2-iminopropanoate deaminase
VSPAREVRTEHAPAPIGPYSQAVIHAGLVYVSGQIPLDPATGEVVEGEIEIQATQVFANLSAVLEAAGSGIERVLRTSIYLTDLSLFPRVNAIYERRFTGDPKPARSTIGVASLPLGVQIEVDAIATTDAGR